MIDKLIDYTVLENLDDIAFLHCDGENYDYLISVYAKVKWKDERPMRKVLVFHYKDDQKSSLSRSLSSRVVSELMESQTPDIYYRIKVIEKTIHPYGHSPSMDLINNKINHILNKINKNEFTASKMLPSIEQFSFRANGLSTMGYKLICSAQIRKNDRS